MSWNQIIGWSKNVQKTVAIWSNIVGLLFRPLTENYKVVCLITFSIIAICYKDNSIFLMEFIMPLIKKTQQLKILK